MNNNDGRRSVIFLLHLLPFATQSFQRHLHISSTQPNGRISHLLHRDRKPFAQSISDIFTSDEQSLSSDFESIENHTINEAIVRLCESGDTNKAIELLSKRERELKTGSTEHTVGLDTQSYMTIMRTLSSRNEKSTETALQVQDLLDRMKEIPGCSPNFSCYGAAIWAWSKSYSPISGSKCEILLRELWGKYNLTEDQENRPSTSTYISTLLAYSRSNMGKLGAEKAEPLLEEMELLRQQGHTFIAPNAVAVNVVL